MKVVAFNGSPRKDGNTSILDEGIQTMQVLGENMAWLLKKLYC
jgi:hypothetical protein